jgi:autotransporter translocation and assembly factor TamB
VYARYTYGVFSRVGALLLRYRLTEHLTLDAGVGETQSIDILYTIERD